MNFKTEQRKQESWPVQKFRQLVTTSKHTFTLISQLLTVLLFLIWKFSPNLSSVQVVRYVYCICLLCTNSMLRGVSSEVQVRGL